jgi:hypothetical protein
MRDVSGEAAPPAHDPDPAHNPSGSDAPSQDQEHDHDQEQEIIAPFSVLSSR